MKLPALMLAVTIAFLVLLLAGALGGCRHASAYYAGVMFVLTGLNLWEDWREAHSS